MRRISDPDYVYTPWSPERRAAARERELARRAKLQPSKEAPRCEVDTRRARRVARRQVDAELDGESRNRVRSWTVKEFRAMADLIFDIAYKAGWNDCAVAIRDAAHADREQSAAAESNRGAARVESREAEGH